jgi:hypothetical protein
MTKRISHSKFDEFVKENIKQKKTFNLLIKRDYVVFRQGNKSVFYSRGKNKITEGSEVKKQPVITSNSNNQTSISKQNKSIQIYSEVRRSFTRYLKNNQWEISTVNNNSGSHFQNIHLWEMLEIGTNFSYIDIKHAYWQYAHRLGYVSDELYNKSLKKEFKKDRNKALACLVSIKDCIYYKDGERINNITEWNKPYKTMYDNIRFSVFNDIMELREVIGDDNILQIKIDCIMFLPHCYEQVFEYFRKKKIKHKNRNCKKIMKDLYYFTDDFLPKTFR